MDLVARVVHVKLPPHVVARPLQHTGQRVAQHAAPGVADVHGARGVGGDELHHDRFALPLVDGAVPLSLRLNVAEHVRIPLAAQSKVQEARSRDLHLVKITAGQIQMLHDGLGDLPGRPVQRLGPRHGKGGGVIPVFHVLGDLDGSLHLRACGQDARRRRFFVGALGQGMHLFPRRLDHV